MNLIDSPLKTLSQCVQYKNLTSASQHVGLSQPQLSRIIKQLEEELDIVLLDRSSPRHSSWTKNAKELAIIYKNIESKVVNDVNLLLQKNEQKEIRVGTLEGLSELALQKAHIILQDQSIITVELDLYDLDELEAKFLSSDLDIIFTSRMPGKTKYKSSKCLGYQEISNFQKAGEDYAILSSFEALSGKTKKNKKFVSNSLVIRKSFLNKYGGQATFPSEIKLTKKGLKEPQEVLVIAQNHVSKSIWDYI